MFVLIFVKSLFSFEKLFFFRIKSERLSQKVNEMIQQSKEKRKKIIAHCSFGIGRAGVTAACLIRKLGLLKTKKEIIQFLRRTRNPNCIESRSQQEYLAEYLKYTREIGSN